MERKTPYEPETTASPQEAIYGQRGLVYWEPDNLPGSREAWARIAAALERIAAALEARVP